MTRAEIAEHDARIFANLTPEQIADSDVLDYSIDPMELGEDVLEVADESGSKIDERTQGTTPGNSGGSQ